MDCVFKTGNYDFGINQRLRSPLKSYIYFEKSHLKVYGSLHYRSFRYKTISSSFMDRNLFNLNEPIYCTYAMVSIKFLILSYIGM